MSYVTPVLYETVSSLITYLENCFDKRTETMRVARIGICLLITGGDRNTNINLKSRNLIIGSQQADGGWTDNEETILSLSFLERLEYINNEYFDRGILWLRDQRHPDGGWGRTNRDISRIPITGLLLHLLPELSDQKAVEWLKNEWTKDFESQTRLTYKGAFFLLGLSASGVSTDDCLLIKRTYSFLADEQNDDGGFGPWKDHPIGSDPWSTGIVLLGLLSYPELVKREVLEKAVNWLGETQLPNGLWAYHYIEEGSAYAYWGLVESLKFLCSMFD